MDLVGDFLRITANVHRDVAVYYLECFDNNIQSAVQAYRDDVNIQRLNNLQQQENFGKDSHATGGKEQRKVVATPVVVEPVVEPVLEPVLEPVVDPVAEFTCREPKILHKELKVIEWNIQGLLEEGIDERMQKVAYEINIIKPEAVLLQEVTNRVFEILKRYYTDNDFHLQKDRGHYYVAIQTQKSSISVLKKTTTDFEDSKQGRKLLTVEGVYEDLPVAFITSHWESGKPMSSERMKQLFEVGRHIAASNPGFVIFGADTNLRDFEYNILKKDKNSAFGRHHVSDVWEMVGTPENSRFIWDLLENDNQIKGGNARCRSQRMYTMAKPVEFKPFQIELIGKKRLKNGLFPSDHWDMVATFRRKIQS